MIFFLVPNTPASPKGYIARTVRRPTVGGEALIRRINESETTLSVKLEFRKERGGGVVESGFLRSVWRKRE